MPTLTVGRCANSFEDCGSLLAAMGTDMSAFSQQCSGIEQTHVSRVVETAICTPILSCHNALGPLHCVDENEGGGATREQLQNCRHWASQDGRWTPSSDPCNDIGSLVTNGDFSTDDISAFLCNVKWRDFVDLLRFLSR